MAEGGALPFQQVIHVLETALSHVAGTSVSVAGNVLTLVKDGVPEVILLPEEVTRRMVSRLSRKHGVNIEWFYHPEMLHLGSSQKQ